jgi:hypothetical protein
MKLIHNGTMIKIEVKFCTTNLSHKRAAHNKNVYVIMDGGFVAPI